MKFRIKERREELGMSQRQLIEKSGLSKTEIYELENGITVDMKVSTLRALMKALDCGISKLVD